MHSRRPPVYRSLAALVLCAGMVAMQPAASADGPSIGITRPHAEETIHDNTGAVPVAVTLQGAAIAPGNRLRVLIDGKTHGADRRALAFTLEGIERGTHALQVQLFDARDALLAASPVVTFHLWQASLLLPTRKPAAVVPGKP